MIAIIIIGFNEIEHLKKCLPSITGLDYEKYKIFFVDNKSTDGSIEFIEKKFPKVKIIRNDVNYGFSKANNIGIKKALEEGFDYFFILNPDTILDKTCLSKLSEKMEPNCIIQPIIFLYPGRQSNLINTTGNYLNFLGFSYCNNYKKKLNEIKLDKEIPTASGAAMIISRKIINRIGIFDENIFPYHEDLDLCWRARIAGFNIKLIPEAKIWHQYEFMRNKNKFLYIEKNRLLFIIKNYEIKTIMLILPWLLVNELLMIAFSIKNKWFAKKMISYKLFFQSLPKIVRKRKTINKLRKISDKELKKFWNSAIGFDEVRIPFLKLYNYISDAYWRAIRWAI